MKTLEIVWIAEEDKFTFSSNNVDDDFNYTKRNFLKKISTLFDPLGLRAPFTIRSKILMQETWNAGIDWDEKVPDTIKQKMKKWFQELEMLDLIKWILSLNSRKKWNKEKDDFKAGDVVLVLSTDTPRGQWPLGRITKTFTGSDDRVRVVNVQVGQNELTRSVHKLVPLEFDGRIDKS